MPGAGGPSEAVALVGEYLAALSGTDPDAVADLVADDFVNEHLGALGSGCIGRKEYRRRLPEFFASLPGRAYRLVDAIVEHRADHTVVVVHYRLTATVDGRRVDLGGMMWITVRSGEIARRIDSWDGVTFLRQTGHDV
jgi:ketosteroid isomerase-like protein